MTPQPWQIDQRVVDDGARFGPVYARGIGRKTAPKELIMVIKR